jgi:hypothetical protein
VGTARGPSVVTAAGRCWDWIANRARRAPSVPRTSRSNAERDCYCQAQLKFLHQKQDRAGWIRQTEE